MHDALPDAAEKLYRLFLEETAPSFETYTVREGAFPAADDADEWLRKRDAPLPLAPQPPGELGRRATAARSRTTTAAAPAPSPTVPGLLPTAPGVARGRGGPS